MNKLDKKHLKYLFDNKYAYRWTWLGVPVIQFPQDLMMVASIIHRVKPDLIVETGVAHGGSLLFYASMMEVCGINSFRVIGVDKEIREHTKLNIKRSSYASCISLWQGNSTDIQVFHHILEVSNCHGIILVVLDSNHTEAHVLRELQLYSQLVNLYSYIVVCDTCVEHLPKGYFKDRPWDKGNSPARAIKKFLKNNRDFIVDKTITSGRGVSTNLGGHLKRVNYEQTHIN